MTGHGKDTLPSAVPKMTQPIDMSFGLWTLVGRRKHMLHRATLAPPGEYD